MSDLLYSVVENFSLLDALWCSGQGRGHPASTGASVFTFYGCLAQWPLDNIPGFFRNWSFPSYLSACCDHMPSLSGIHPEFWVTRVCLEILLVARVHRGNMMPVFLTTRLPCTCGSYVKNQNFRLSNFCSLKLYSCNSFSAGLFHTMCVFQKAYLILWCHSWRLGKCVL